MPNIEEVVSRDVLAALRLGRLIASAAAHANEITPRLKSCQFEKARSPVAERLVFVVGEKRPVILQTAVDATILDIANAIEFARLGHRQGFQQHRMHEREDGRGRANSEGERQYGRRGKTGGMGELSQCITDIFPELHGSCRPWCGSDLRFHIRLNARRLFKSASIQLPLAVPVLWTRPHAIRKQSRIRSLDEGTFSQRKAYPNK